MRSLLLFSISLALPSPAHAGSAERVDACKGIYPAPSISESSERDRFAYLKLATILDRDLKIESTSVTAEYKNLEGLSRIFDWRRLRQKALTPQGRSSFLATNVSKLFELRMDLSTTIKLGEPRETEKSVRSWLDADDTVWQWVTAGEDLSLDRLKTLHQILLSGAGETLLPPGTFRTSGIEAKAGAKKERAYLPGSQVSRAMADFMVWYLENRDGLHPISLAAESYRRLVSIHPFTDGNGRLARLVMDWILQRSGFPPAALIADEKQSVTRVALFGSNPDAMSVTTDQLRRSVVEGLKLSFELLRTDPVARLSHLSAAVANRLKRLNAYLAERRNSDFFRDEFQVSKKPRPPMTPEGPVKRMDSLKTQSSF